MTLSHTFPTLHTLRVFQPIKRGGYGGTDMALKTTISQQYRDIMKANEGKPLDIKMFPRDMWLSQAELSNFMWHQRKQMGLSEVRYHCELTGNMLYWEDME